MKGTLDTDAVLEVLRRVEGRQVRGGVVSAAARENAVWVIEQEELERRLREPERRELRRFWKAVVLAKDVETLEALLDGEKVPVERLDAEWVRRFGRRR